MGGSRFYAFSIFLVWLTKLAILRIGGIALYNRSKPYFIGLEWEAYILKQLA